MTTPGTSGVEVSPQFPVLDTLRAIGALAVLTTHTSFQTGEYLGNGVGGTLLARLDVGVAIFFVLSGFLLSRAWLARQALGLPRPGLSTYYEKRALRILPVYLVVVVIAYLFVGGNEDAGVGNWLSSTVLIDSFVGKSLPYGLTHMWSLAVEATFYLVLPVLMVAVRPRRSGRSLAGLLGAMLLLSVLWLALSPHLDTNVAGSPGLWLPAYLTWFAAGIGLAAVHVAHQQGSTTWVVQQVVALGRLPGVCWSLAIGLLLVAATPLAGPTLLEASSVTESITKHLLYAGIGTLLVLSGVFTAPGTYSRVMAWQALRHLGHISYSVFCVHLAVLAGAFHLTGVEVFTGHGLLIWTTTLVLSLAASEVLYRVVEMPALRLQGRLRRHESVATSTTSPDTTATTR
ncbi:acyltransferase family protein [Nocardioides hwasunensis]|uniref:Acyltransferase n=1 Tax=Nocardioides hwasunensis TaxID=397258 RepID=A0ABR8MEU1_9ACTN|nr:acyltransferase [Nocardioides hwasunensis]MBD3914615.1 acyltransferase [Nocardioides hwasunensis]